MSTKTERVMSHSMRAAIYKKLTIELFAAKKVSVWVKHLTWMKVWTGAKAWTVAWAQFGGGTGDVSPHFFRRGDIICHVHPPLLSL